MEATKEKSLDVQIKTLADLEKCEWNGVFMSSYIWVQVFNLHKNGVNFMGQDEFGMNIKSVSARVSNFEVFGRTFNVDASTKMHKYDGKKGEMYFLQGLYLDSSKEPFYYLEFLEYIKGQELPKIHDFVLNKRDVIIPV
jgi:hypothetical protein